MSSVVKLFHTVKKFYTIIGSLSASNVFRLSSFVAAYISVTAFFFFEAQTADENGTSFYVSISLLVIAINTSITIANMAIILELIENYEEFIAKSWFDSNGFLAFSYTQNYMKYASISRADSLSNVIAHLHRIG